MRVLVTGGGGFLGSHVVEREGRADFGGDDAFAEELADATDQAEHGQNALTRDPLGEPESLDALLTDHQNAGIDLDGFSRERAIEEQAAAGRQ